MRKKEIFRLGLVASVCLCAGLLAAAWLQPDPRPQGITGIGGDWTLQSAHGPVSLSKDLKGKVVALYFGFATCPDACPASLHIMAAGLRRLDAAEQAGAQLVFVSVDPERDDPQQLARYAQAFDSGMLGLTADLETIKQVAWNYRAIFKKTPLPDSALGYTIDHSSIIYIIGKDGVIQSLAQHGASADEVAEKIKQALES